jgi:hypothetical protein
MIYSHNKEKWPYDSIFFFKINISLNTILTRLLLDNNEKYPEKKSICFEIKRSNLTFAAESWQSGRLRQS